MLIEERFCRSQDQSIDSISQIDVVYAYRQMLADEGRTAFPRLEQQDSDGENLVQSF